MLRGNLSSRPFYNDRLASLAIGAVALVAVLLTGFNIWRLTVLSSHRAEVRARLDTDQREIERIQAEAARLRRSVDRPTLTRLAGATREANELIDQRTFSWTTLFGLLEKTLPMDVRLVSVAPRVEKGVFKVGVTVVGRDFGDVDDFVEAMFATGTFYDVAPTEQQRNDDGTYGALIEASYIPPGSAPAPAPAAAGASPAPATGGGKP